MWARTQEVRFQLMFVDCWCMVRSAEVLQKEVMAQVTCVGTGQTRPAWMGLMVTGEHQTVEI